MTWTAAFSAYPRLAAGGLMLLVAALAMALAFATRSLALRRATTAGILLALALFAAAQLAAFQPATTPWLPHQLPLLLGYALAAAAGVATRRAWGRWLALGGGLAGVIGFGGMMLFIDGRAHPAAVARTLLLIAGSALLVAGTAGRAMREHLTPRADALARVPGRRAAVLRAGVLLALAATPYLLMFALEPWAPTTIRLLAAVAAALLTAGAVTVTRGHTAGLLVTAGGAVAASALMALVAVAPWWPALLPAPAGTLLALAAVAGPAWRRLR